MLPSWLAPFRSRSAHFVLLALAPFLASVGCRPVRPSSANDADASRRGRVKAACTTKSVSAKTVRAVLFSSGCGPALAQALQGVVAEPVVGYWQPGADAIASIDERLRPALELGRKKPESLAVMPKDEEDRRETEWGVASAIEYISGHFGEYRCQYLGIVVARQSRRVLVNCFADDEVRDWVDQWFDSGTITDGGPAYFRIQYDVATGGFLGFDINTSA